MTQSVGREMLYYFGNPDYLFHAGLNLPLQTSGEFLCPFTQRQRKKMDRFSPAQIYLLNNLRESPRKISFEAYESPRFFRSVSKNLS